MLAFVFGDPAGEEFAVTLKCADDIAFLVVAAKVGEAGLDRAAVDHDAGAIQPTHGHDAAGHVLVAAGQGDAGVVPLGTHHRFDRVGDQVARLQRIAHAGGAHRDAVGDADGVEPHADQPGRLDPFLHLGSQVAEVHVAGVALVPHAGDADLRLVHVVVGHAGAVEHGLRGTLRFGLGDVAAVFVERCGQGNFLLLHETE